MSALMRTALDAVAEMEHRKFLVSRTFKKDGIVSQDWSISQPPSSSHSVRPGGHDDSKVKRSSVSCEPSTTTFRIDRLINYLSDSSLSR